ncbi:6311_t:CDS:2, partial [Paraglomus occultum]
EIISPTIKFHPTKFNDDSGSEADTLLAELKVEESGNGIPYQVVNSYWNQVQVAIA